MTGDWSYNQERRYFYLHYWIARHHGTFETWNCFETPLRAASSSPWKRDAGVWVEPQTRPQLKLNRTFRCGSVFCCGSTPNYQLHSWLCQRRVRVKGFYSAFWLAFHTGINRSRKYKKRRLMGLAERKEKPPWQISATFYNVEVIKSQIMSDFDG